ncbi:MAG: hypothetical protein U5L03_10735 [Burkholderiaceae bacterium]|nr:hypothetical protein [Burkholderiaceae bacterium]
MGFKRFVAATTKDAMTQVRRELGDDAVILSNKRVANGHIEILAAASHAVEAIVEDARRPAARAAAPASASVQIAPGVRRVGVAVESFQDFLRRQRPATGPAPARTTAAARPGTVGGASMYSAVAQATANEDSLDGLADELGDHSAADDGWANSRFDPTLMAPSRIATPSTRGPDTRGGTPSRTGSPRTAPAIDTWLPNAARVGAVVQGTVAVTPPTAARVAPEATTMGADAPAVFRRRPSRESAPATINVPLDTMLDTMRRPAAAAPMPVAPEAAVARVPMSAPAALSNAPATAPLPSIAGRADDGDTDVAVAGGSTGGAGRTDRTGRIDPHRRSVDPCRRPYRGRARRAAAHRDPPAGAGAGLGQCAIDGRTRQPARLAAAAAEFAVEHGGCH